MIKVYASSKIKDNVTKALLQDYCWYDPIGFRSYANARVLPWFPDKRFSGGVVDSSGAYVDSSALHENAYDGSYEYVTNSVERVDRTAVFLGTWIGIYGHAITDNIKKLWFLFTEDYKMLGPDIDLLYCYLGEGDLPVYIKEILLALGIAADSLKRVETVTEYKNVIIPDNSFILSDGQRFYTDSFRTTVSRIIDNAPTLTAYPEKIYLSRKKSSSFRDYGEAELAETFAQHGFEIVVPEEHSFLEQVAIFSHCKCLAATEGSIAHNAVFCRPETELVILRKSDYINTYQSALDAMNSLNVSYIDAHHTVNVSDPWVGPFFIWRTKYLNEYFGETIKEKSRWLCNMWYKYLVRVFMERVHIFLR